MDNAVQPPRSLEADVESCGDSAGVYSLDDWVVTYGSYSERDADFEIVSNWAAKVVAADRGLPIPMRCHWATSWCCIIEADGCVDEVLRSMQEFWYELLMIYAEWLALQRAA
jgi:hypothetical protein